LTYSLPTDPATSWQETWRRLAPLVPRARQRTTVIGVAGALGGVLEAGLILIVVRLALALADGEDAISVARPLGDITLGFGAFVVVALALAAGRLALQAFAAHTAAVMSAGTLETIGTTLVGGVLRAPWSIQSADREGRFQEIATNQSRRVAKATLSFGLGLSSVLSFVVLLAAAVVVEPIAAAAMLAVGTGLFLALRPVSSLARRKSAQESVASVDFAHSLVEASRLGAEVRLFGAADAVAERVGERLRRVSRLHYVSVALSRLVPVLYQSTAMVLIVVGLWGVYLSGTSRVGVIGALVLILVRALTYAQSGQSYFHEVARESPYVDQVNEAIARYELVDASASAPLAPIETVALTEVGYEHGRGEPALRGVSIDGRRGDLVGIVGPSGAGKTTLAEILVRLRLPQSGAYLVDGRSAASIAREAWTRQVAAVPQTPRLFDGTVAENIRFHRDDIDDEQIVAAARAANIHDEVAAFPDGYDTEIGQSADGVSGGQAQRLCLARALAGEPSMLVLDEPTSAVDARSELLIRDSLLALRDRTLVFIVTHRSAMIDACDRVVRLDEGRLAELDLRAGSS
jgi:ATP-binding cassette subfamily B protein